MKIIISGATGFLGRHLSEHCANAGWQVIGLGRNKAKGKLLEQKGIEFRCVDLTDKTELQKNFSEADAVIHSAALSSVWGPYKEFYKHNVLATKNIVEVCKKHQCKKIIHISSPSIYFNYQDRLDIHEEALLPKRFVNAYAKTKHLAENIVTSECSDALPWVILRPRGIFGEHDSTIFPRLLKRAQSGKIPLINNGNAKIDVTYVKNVVHAIVLAINNENSNNDAYNITNHEPVKITKLLQMIFSEMNMDIKYQATPYWLADKVTLLRDNVHQLLNLSEPSITRYGLNLLAKSQTLNNTKSLTKLGYRPLYTINEGIKAYVNWYKQQL